MAITQRKEQNHSTQTKKRNLRRIRAKRNLRKDTTINGAHVPTEQSESHKRERERDAVLKPSNTINIAGLRHSRPPNDDEARAQTQE